MEIIKQTKLLNKKGHLTSPGWARSQAFSFNREKARPKLRLKEWDFYQIHTEEYILQMTIGHIGLASSFSAVLFSHKTGKRYSFGKYRPFPLIPKMPRNADLDHQVSLEKKNFSISFTVKNKVRHLQFKALDFEIDLSLSSFPEAEKLAIATPFEKPNQFYFNSKENCFKVSGYVRAKDLEVKFSDRDYGLLDWGRGVWPYRQTWTWGNASGLLDDGRTFGLNIGFGFGNLEQATENALFIDGKLHKLDQVILKERKDFLSDWVFTSNDGRFEMTLSPTFDNYNTTKILWVDNSCHQVFGHYHGKVILDTKEVLEVKDIFGFCEEAHNKW